jgi:hypothetical protein
MWPECPVEETDDKGRRRRFGVAVGSVTYWLPRMTIGLGAHG